MKLKNIIIISVIFVLVSILMIACAEQTAQQPQLQEPKQEVTAPSPQPAAEPVPTPPNEPEPAQQVVVPVSPEDKEQILKKLQKIKTLNYATPDDKQNIYVDTVKDLVRIRYNSALKKLDNNGLYSELIIDRKNKKVVTYCAIDRCNKDEEDLYISYSVNYEKFNIVTILDYIKNMKQIKSDKSKTKQIKSIPSTFATFIDNEDKTGEMWSDDFYGIPLSIQQGDGTELVKDLFVNNIEFEEIKVPSHVTKTVDYLG
ncbi:TPA: hypothetical protein HA246_02680 [Candidatus Woesearchaeota archaeon]|nr:hypothetical protein [Candidatus Woesearchaeota archaeon]